MNLLKNMEKAMGYQLEETKCDYCQSSDCEIYIKDAKELYNDLGGAFNVVKCSNCGFIFTNPRPTRETMGFFYPDDSGYFQPQCLKDSESIFERVIFASILGNHYNYHIKNSLPKVITAPLYAFLKRRLDLLHIPKMSPHGNLLDIGCSWGGYMHRMQRLGWNVFGIEPNKKAVEFAKKELGLINVFQGSIDDIKFEESFFDVVHMSMVLEHVYHPLDTLLRVNKIIKKGGQLIIIVPDISGFEAQIYKDKSYGLQVPEHLSHFTPKTMKNFLDMAGFGIERIVHHNFDRDLVASAGYLSDKRLYSVLSNKVFRRSVVKLFINLLSILNKSSRMSVYARKLHD